MVADGLGSPANILGIRHQYHNYLYAGGELSRLTGVQLRVCHSAEPRVYSAVHE
jgi:hypothetical protein